MPVTSMKGFRHDESGDEVASEAVRIKQFILGRAKMQMESRGVVELTDGTVRVFNVRRPHNPNSKGHLKTLGDPLNRSFDDAVEGLLEFESWWITEEVDEVRSSDSMSS